MIRQLKIAREGQDLGAWPFDVIFALVRCGSLVPTDTYWIDGMEDPKPLSEIIPPSPSHTKSVAFLGRDDEDMMWVFYCRDGSTVIGPRPVDEIVGLIFLGALTEDNLVFVASGDRWLSVADFLRMIEKDAPGTIDQCRCIQAAVSEASPSNASVQSDPQAESDNPDWLQTGLNLTWISPHIGGAYLGWNAVKRLRRWIEEPQPKSPNQPTQPNAKTDEWLSKPKTAQGYWDYPDTVA